jgi:DNA polymerase III subunit delta
VSAADAVVVVRGRDATLRAEALHALVTELVGTDDRTLALAEFDVAAPPESVRSSRGDLSAEAALVLTALDAVRTIPFGSSRRIVVLRNASQLAADDTKPIAAYVGSAEPTAVLVLDYGDKSPPAALAKALKAAEAREITVDEQIAGVLSQHAKAAGIRLERDATELITTRLGEDVGRVSGIVDVLASTFGPGARLTADDVEPYLGDEGGVPIYKLTNAIDEGDHVEALAVLARLRDASGLHPLQVMASLHGHYRRLLRLDDPEIRGEHDAVAALKELTGRPPNAWVAKKTHAHAQALGADGVRAAYDLLAQADLDLRGARRIPDDAVMDLLVTRLATISRRHRRAPAASRGRSRR